MTRNEFWDEIKLFPEGIKARYIKLAHLIYDKDRSFYDQFVNEREYQAACEYLNQNPEYVDDSVNVTEPYECGGEYCYH